jgi:formylglycine-generating enzyme required for sulfatase activity
MMKLVLKFTLLIALVFPGQVEAKPQTKTNSIRMTMVRIPAGEFWMGSSEGDCPKDDPFTEKDESEGCYRTSELPQHKVTLKSFWIAQTEVTQEQWYKVMGNNPSSFKTEKLGYRSNKNPVEMVSWHDAVAFCSKLSQLEKTTYRLPTEAEWEYAARAGTTGRYYGKLSQIAWLNDSGDYTHPVATKSPNSWGLYDMIGNVCEWTADWYDPGYYHKTPRNGWRNPKGPPRGLARVLRGDSFRDYPKNTRVSSRHYLRPDTRFYSGGFRCAQ